MAEEIVYRIHPAIGVARVGDASGDDDFFIGPEVPGLTPNVARKKDGHVLRQAARFRVFAYRRDGGELALVGEVRPGEGGVVELRWHVHLANRKASFAQFDGLRGEAGKYHDGLDMPRAPRRNAGPPSDWEIDPGEKSITGRGAAPVKFDAAGGGNWPKLLSGTPVIDYLGELRTDADGRLLVLGGRGRAASRQVPAAAMPSYANNPTWLDDVSDGPVTAEVVVETPSGTSVVPVANDGKAWCLVTPPDFAPEIESVVTLYDLLVDVAARKLTLPSDERVYSDELGWLRALNQEFSGGGVSLTQFRPSYERDVFPVLERALQYRWTHEPAANAHIDAISDPALADPSPAAAATRQHLFDRLRAPGQPFQARHTMPRLLGDEPYEDFAQAPNRRRLALTRTQYALLERWKDGHFDAPSQVPVPGEHRAVQAVVTPWGLDRAALEACAGGAFYPGIEASWQLRHWDLYIAPFRLEHGAPSTYLDDGNVVTGAGHFSRQMAVPWHADFMDCKVETGTDNTAELKGQWGWWPSQRPDDVPGPGSGRVPWARGQSGDGHEWMVANWAKLGFVLRRGEESAFEEVGRNPTLPP